MGRAWIVYVTAGATFIAVYLALPIGIVRDVAYVVVGLSTVAAMLVGVLVHRPRRPGAWHAMAGGQLCLVVGDGLFCWYQDVAGRAPTPSVADAFYFVAYALLGVGLVVLIRARSRRTDLSGLIDSALVTVALGLLSWVVLAGPIARDETQSALDRVVGVAYPAADILLLALLVRFVVGAGARTASFRLLTAGIVLQLVADTAFAVAGPVSTSGVLDLLWLSGYLLWGTAALHPSMRAMSEPGGEPPALSVARLTVLTLTILVAPFTLLAELVLARPLDVWPVTLCSVVLFALVSLRMQLGVREVRASVQQRDLARDHLVHRASHDSLTDLTNRSRVVEIIEAALGRGQRGGTLVGLLFVDLDRFKAVNDAHGHAAGDAALQEIARRLRTQVRAGDTVGRLGGDEFVVLVEAPESERALVDLAERILRAVAAPLPAGGREVAMTASIGVAVARGGGPDADQLLYEADAASARAKVQGRGRVEIFDDALRREHHARVELEVALRTALDEGQLVLHFQPVVHLPSLRTAGYEALVRWQRPGHGLVPPDEFIPTAELSNLICDLDRWVLGAATRWFAQCEAARDESVTVAVNVSGRHLGSAEIVADVTAALQAARLSPDRLVLEITETVLFDQSTARVHLHDLQELGVRISIDDFGTGYTSIGQLQHLAVDALKIDRSLVISSRPGADELVRLVVQAGHAFGLTVVGEGVELESQLRRLEEAGCDLAQGYLFARPQPAAALVTVRGVGAQCGTRGDLTV